MAASLRPAPTAGEMRSQALAACGLCTRRFLCQHFSQTPAGLSAHFLPVTTSEALPLALSLCTPLPHALSPAGHSPHCPLPWGVPVCLLFLVSVCLLPPRL